MGRRRAARWAAAGLAALVVAGGTLGGCASGDGAHDDRAAEPLGDAATATTAGPMGPGAPDAWDDGSSEEAAELDRSGGAADGGDDAAATGGGGADGAASLIVQGTLAESGRKIISTAEMTVAVADVASGTERAVEAAVPLGGLLFGQDSSLEGDPRAVLTFKVPPEQFAELSDRLAELGTLRSQHVTTDDVTEQVVDLEARITTTRASVERIRALIAEAADVTDIAALEGELLRRETELESLEGQLRTLSDRIDLATITLTLVEATDPDDPSAVPALALGTDRPGFLDGLDAGLGAAASVASGLAVLAGVLVPVLPVAAVVALVMWLRRRRGLPAPVVDSSGVSAAGAP